MNQSKSNHVRIAKWDNLKFLMMLCVVIGHTIYYFYSGSTLGKSIYLFIYLFHMPAFVFISGMFSKNKINGKRFDVVIQYVFIYIFMQFLDAVNVFLKNRYVNPGSARKFSFHLFWSEGPEWYALAMAVFIVVTMLIKDCDKTYTFLCVCAIGCMAGLDSHLGNHFASMRLCTFYPVFLAGYYMEPVRLELSGSRFGSSAWLKTCSRIIAALVLALAFIICVAQEKKAWPYINFLKGKENYVALHLGMKGVLLRLLCYGLWACLVFCVIILCTERKHFWTWLGERTQSTFIWHKFFLVLLLECLGLKNYFKVNIPHYLIPASICLAIIVAVLTAYLPGFSVRYKKPNKKSQD